jgi:TolB-like protein/Tfp pilus assembly protein PilF
MSTEPAPAGIISHYRLIELIGRGAMGEVWLAEDTQLPRKVAVKLLPRHLAEDPEAVQRLLREAQAAASVDHPAVVTVYEAGLTDGRPYLVMQRVEGDTLEQRLTHGPMPVAEVIPMATRIADALAEVHALGIVHRDLKPANIILTPRGPKVLDFGVAAVRGAPRMTATGTAVGTPLTMSPEQLKGLPPDNRSDLWALGAILYESLTGESPFAGASWEAVANRVLNEQPAPPGTRRREVGPDLDFMVMKLLRKDPAHRYARAEDLLADLASCVACRIEAAPGETAAPRLAVLYFEVLSPDPGDAYLAAGLTEDLIVDFTRVAGLQVTSRAEVMPYRDRAVPPRTLARELGVDYLLQGSVRRAGNRARISAQLIRASDGHVLWGERFDRTLEDLFDVQAEVSKRIVDALQVTLRPGEREMLDRAPTRDRQAYEFYLKARELLDRMTRDANARAELLLKSAIERDPDFALAHATLGDCYARRAMTWWAGIEVADLALPHAMRALEIEPDLVEALVVVAMIQRLRGQPAELIQTLEQIMRMNPESAQLLEWAGWSYMTLGKPEQALSILEALVRKHPESYIGVTWLRHCYELLGRHEDSMRALELCRDLTLEAVRRHPDNVHARTILAGNLIELGEREQGLHQIERSIAMAPDDGRVRYNAACAFVKLGMAERAIEELKEGVKNVPSYVADWPKRDPDLVSLHDNPEFIRLFGKA